jgi:hypothetical protein
MYGTPGWYYDYYQQQHHQNHRRPSAMTGNAMKSGLQNVADYFANKNYLVGWLYIQRHFIYIFLLVLLVDGFAPKANEWGTII